jgi:oxygen-independent coproporphyrinogen III oxidase
MAPDHVSLYVLEVEGKTLLSHRARRGRLDLPGDDLVADLYHRTVGAFAALGLERYEISNFARAGRESRHNAKYWDDAPFLGFGLSAHSYRDGRRWWNVGTYGGYCAAVEARGAAGAVAGERRLDARERMSEAAFTGLRRREGIDLAAFGRRHGADLLREYGPVLRDSFAAGLLETSDGRLRLTDRGLLVSNEVFEVFV